ncbi:MAG: preprotein translocase subunit SecE [Thermodesulfobacteriota bacterium]
MKKNKVKAKGGQKEGAVGPARGQVVKLRPGKARPSWTGKLPSVRRYWDASVQFVREAIQELKKVTWPNRRETLGTTAVVLFLVVVIAIFLGLVDFGLSRLVRQVIP